jgi:hypothetical protein
MRQLYRIELDFEKTIPYVKDQLDINNVLSQEISKRIDFNTGNFFTLLPQEADLTDLYSFSIGGKMPTGQVIEQFDPELNQTVIVAERINSIKKEVAEIITTKIKNNDSLACIFEDVTWEPTDNLDEARAKKVLHICNNNVYYIISNSHLAFDSVVSCMSDANAFWHCLFVLSKVGSMNYPEMLTKDTIISFCKHAELIICGAYDGEGYIFWEPHQI